MRSRILRKIKYKRENKNIRKITALLVVLIIFASVFVFAACEDKTPDAIADRSDNLAEEGSFDVKSGGRQRCFRLRKRGRF